MAAILDHLKFCTAWSLIAEPRYLCRIMARPSIFSLAMDVWVASSWGSRLPFLFAIFRPELSGIAAFEAYYKWLGCKYWLEAGFAFSFIGQTLCSQFLFCIRSVLEQDLIKGFYVWAKSHSQGFGLTPALLHNLFLHRTPSRAAVHAINRARI